MASKHTKETINTELKRIQESVPACYSRGLLTERKAFGAMIEVLERALNGNYPEEKKKIWREMLQDPDLHKVEVVEDPKKAEKMDRWVQKQIKESIKAGRLPSKAQLKKLNILYDKNEKTNS